MHYSTNLANFLYVLQKHIKAFIKYECCTAINIIIPQADRLSALACNFFEDSAKKLPQSQVRPQFFCLAQIHVAHRLGGMWPIDQH